MILGLAHDALEAKLFGSCALTNVIYLKTVICSLNLVFSVLYITICLVPVFQNCY